MVSLRHDKIGQVFYTSHSRPSNALAIDDLRADLRSRLAGYKLPTLLPAVLPGEFHSVSRGSGMVEIEGYNFAEVIICGCRNSP